MSRLRTIIRKVDGNHKDVVSAFRSLQYAVMDTHTLGKGAPDICVSKAGQNFLVEIKDGRLPASARKLTPDEKIFHRQWLGPLIIINSIEDVLEFDRRRFKSLPQLLAVH